MTAMMRTLAIECASEACSVALFEGERMTLVDHRHEVLGRGHAERLVPMIAELPERGRADRICVSRGPGSFTGIRIGIAAARALGIAWGAQVLGYPTLALVAARSWQPKLRPVSVCMEGGHSQWFVQNFDEQRRAEDDVCSLPHEEAAAACRHAVIVGNRASEAASILAGGRLSIDLGPDARHFPLLATHHLTGTVSAIYGRAADAKPARKVAAPPA
ncbi:tRNA (adenosine(37)-N6)-threonylcarbamoyltransferase complex dimerization subunit type 1 TsaB [Erythrobacteraceae bacterium WH01K]|nr:tRNA (adenosine(37)-N6)-threonylcarbamoyltransferase complex dimerization subunit type 1 TsaB [Erythrobacteraceae bacterium WH01K]